MINLPRRGPSPTLKNESRITIKVMDDIIVPDVAPSHYSQYGFAQRPEPISYAAPRQEQLQGQPDEQLIALVFHGSFVMVHEYWDAGHGKLGVRTTSGRESSIELDDLDINATIERNHANGIEFHVPGSYRATNNWEYTASSVDQQQQGAAPDEQSSRRYSGGGHRR